MISLNDFRFIKDDKIFQKFFNEQATEESHQIELIELIKKMEPQPNNFQMIKMLIFKLKNNSKFVDSSYSLQKKIAEATSEAISNVFFVF